LGLVEGDQGDGIAGGELDGLGEGDGEVDGVEGAERMLADQSARAGRRWRCPGRAG
jgi:hypothetical protein